MSLSQKYVDYVLDQLAVLGPVQSRRMFGGAGLYFDGVFFGLIAGDALYLKVDETNKQDYIDADAGPFKPFGKDSYEMNYYEVPGDALEDPDQLKEWAMKALLVAKRMKAVKGKRVRGKRK